ncbi:MAG: PhoU domain-containing protein [Acidobacteriota bacterium]|nr:PhoU domain-containing protein [Acidobacteriota bacterium]
MFRELLSIFRSKDVLAEMGENFARMLQLAHEMTLTAGAVFFGKKISQQEHDYLYQQDIRVNQSERSIRKQVVAHLSIQGNRLDVPYCLLLMSLVKDVERLGDYAKNILELADVGPDQFPEDEVVTELQSIRQGVEDLFEAALKILSSSESDQALRLIREGREIAQRSDGLIESIARANYDASTTTALVLGTRYYKRIGGHLLNVISSVVMPLHKVDYFDEDEILSRP